MLQNLLIKGNNLLALHSLKTRLAGKVKLIYIDPPYNTGNDSFKYNDNFNHSSWLVFMKNRLEVAKDLLADDGVIFVQIDDNEQAYLKILMDEIFGRENFKECITVKTSTPSGVNAINVKRGERLFKLKEYLLFYSKNKDTKFNPLLIKSKFNNNYCFEVLKTENGYIVQNLKSKFSANELEEYCLKNHKNIYSLEKNNSKAGEKIKAVISQSLDTEEVLEFENSMNKTVLVYNGGVFVPLSERVFNEAGKNHFGVLISDFWDDQVFQTNAREGDVNFKSAKKPEKLLQRIIELSTNKDDIILDYYAGSGTTCAVAHKMGRRWIGIEQMDYIEEITKVRLQKVIDGEQGGISKAVNWQGGGSFVYFELKKYNQEFVEKILSANTKTELNKVYKEMQENAFLQFWFEKEDFKEVFRDDGDNLLDDLTERKNKLLQILDQNQLYLNCLDMNDSKHHVSDGDKALTQAFYGADIIGDDKQQKQTELDF